ncbi:MAG TPA: hypothetical protein VFO64_02280 [Gaiellaceae bacterium]|jgi:hypothetical protein|nr:hypothetical protein [Gaiellaceae bacterium]
MHRSVALGVTAVALVAAFTLLRSEPTAPSATPASLDAQAVSTVPQGTALQLVPRSRMELGSFRLRDGTVLRIATGSLRDGAECLVEEGDGGETRACQEGGLFATRRAELIVGSEGGPDRFDRLHVTGIVAPNVRSASLVKTDGAAVRLTLTPQRTFMFESPQADLEAAVHPTELRLYGPGRKLVGVVDFPPAG